MAESVIYPDGPIRLSDVTDKYKWEPQRTNHFEVIINGLPQELTLAVSMFSLPNITNDPIEVAHQNSRHKYAGQANFAGAESLEVIDYIGLDVEDIVDSWRTQVYNAETDKMGLAADYKRDAYVVEYSPDYEKLRTWKIVGAWPSGVAFGDTLSMEGSEVKKVTLTIAYDRAYRVRD